MSTQETERFIAVLPTPGATTIVTHETEEGLRRGVNATLESLQYRPGPDFERDIIFIKGEVLSYKK